MWHIEEDGIIKKVAETPQPLLIQPSIQKLMMMSFLFLGFPSSYCILTGFKAAITYIFVSFPVVWFLEYRYLDFNLE